MPSNDQVIESLTAWVEEQSGHIHALEHVINALILTHPNPKALVDALGIAQPNVDAMLNGSSLPDEAIAKYHAVIDEMTSLATGRADGI
ncbi:hypothetical protein ACLIKD_08920 [Azonexus sp. IMCC34842]|uniref:hypothetical protein n=1 Tax=Azonexus sp. IMCC34842 TaxID=3420950 RepID=UPI003D140DE9